MSVNVLLCPPQQFQCDKCLSGFPVAPSTPPTLSCVVGASRLPSSMWVSMCILISVQVFLFILWSVRVVCHKSQMYLQRKFASPGCGSLSLRCCEATKTPPANDFMMVCQTNDAYSFASLFIRFLWHLLLYDKVTFFYYYVTLAHTVSMFTCTA